MVLYDNWIFGDDNRGDSLVVAFWQSISMNKPVDMITEDSGINCVDSPKIQEELSFQFILHQSLVAINCFKSNSFIL